MVAPVLVFQNNDGPAASVPTEFDEATLRMRVSAPGCTNPPTWQGVRIPAASALATQLKANVSAENGGAKISKRADVVSLSRVSSLTTSQDNLNASDEAVANLDFRTSAGKRMDNQRREYGSTYGRAPAKPQALNAEEAYLTKADKMKRNRERVNEEIDLEIEGPAAATLVDPLEEPPIAAHRTEAAAKPGPKRAPRGKKSAAKK